jgi:hypothetical protein
MTKLALLLCACLLGVAACSNDRVPDDAQLATLLRAERASPADPAAPLDALAVECLRAWSGDAELAEGLPPRVTGEPARTACRTRVQGWLGDQGRNPANFTFEEVSTPEVARRARALQQAREIAAATNPGSRQVPPALARPASRPQAPMATPASNVDMGAAGAELADAESMCQQAAAAAAAQGARSNLQRFAKYCSSNLKRLRASMESVAKKGADDPRLEGYGKTARNLANTARNLLAAPPG